MTRYVLFLSALLFLADAAAGPAQTPNLTQLNQAFFQTYDSNHDGVVTRKEFLAPCIAHFNLLDSNKDGVIDRQEVANFTRKMIQQRNLLPQKTPAAGAGATR